MLPVNNDLIRFNFEGREIRTVLLDREPWFVAKDVAERLGYTWNGFARIAHVPEEWRGATSVVTPSGNQEMAILSEQGLYFFLARSDKPKALPFQKWIAGEVLPQIRRTGSYLPAMPKTLPEALRAYADEVERRDRAEKALEAAAPKIEFYDAVADARDAVPMHKVAKMLELGMGRNQLFAFLRERKVLMSDNTPYQEYADRGYFSVKEKHWKDGGGTPHVAMSTYVYQKGIEFIRNLILEENTEKYHRPGRAFRSGFHISRTPF